jgi:DNA-binding SARP family transcriptional activator
MLHTRPWYQPDHRNISVGLAGCRADALSLYRAAREATIAELGLEPSPDLRRLQQQILLDAPALTALARSRLELTVPRA